MPTVTNKIEPIIYLLTLLVLFFTFVVLGLAWLRPNDGQTFQLVAGLLTGTFGCLIGKIDPDRKKNNDEQQQTLPVIAAAIDDKKGE